VSTQSERREDKRFQINLKTLVRAKSADGDVHCEKTVLHNLSGGGANFITGCADRYFQGQQLEIKIDLPGVAGLKAALQGTATVTRIEPLSDSDQRRLGRRYAVAVAIAVPLRFFREEAAARAEKPAGERS